MPDGRIRFGYFYRSLPMLAAERLGIDRRHGLEVEYHQVASSTQQFQWLGDGRYDIVQTSPDNVANYRYNRRNPLGGTIDAQGFMGMDHGMNLVLAARPGIGAASELRGRTVAVDALASGFAYVIYEILRQAGLRRDEDYSVVSVGGVADRHRLLVSADPGFEATLLNGGFEVRAAEAGFTLLDPVSSVADPYVGAWAVARREWLESRREVAAAFVAAQREATAWCFAGENREACLDLLSELPRTDRGLAERLLDVQLRPGVGNIPDGDLVLDGVRNVLELRRSFGGFEEDRGIDWMLTDGEMYDAGLL